MLEVARSYLSEVSLGSKITLTASDNHTLGGYRAEPKGTPKGGLVVVQEIFGVNKHIRHVCDMLAENGYVAVAPAVFDRFERDFDSGYSVDEIAHARSFLGGLNWDHLMADVAAAQASLKGVGPLGVIGFCLGGTAAFMTACRVSGFVSAVSFYGGAIAKFADEKPRCPIQMHFGDKDESIPMSMVEEIRKKQPQAEIHVYENSPHAFSNDDRAGYNKTASDLAWKRTYEFFAKTMK